MTVSAGLLTVHCSANPGASLQAHALAQKIADYADEVTIINYCPDYFLELMDPRKRKEWSLKQRAKALLVGAQLKNRYGLFQEFSRDYLPEHTQRFDTAQQMKAAKLEFSHYLCGSDQIWNPQNVNYDSSFFFDFVENSKAVKASYAASIGQKVLTPEGRDFLKKGIQQMDAVSIRENDGVQLVTGEFGIPAQQHVDPTLLYPGSYWRAMERKPVRSIPQRYILYYPIHRGALSASILKELKRKHGLPVVAVDGGVKKSKYVDYQIRAYGPREFLWLLDHADYIVTNSFHGVVLSTLLEKRVIAYRHHTRNSRLSSVLELLQLPQIQVDSLQQALDMDWAQVARKQANVESLLATERARAEQYLKAVFQK